MDFSFSDEQRMLADTVERWVQDLYPFERRRLYAKEPFGFSAKNWQQMAELGLLAIPFAEQDGGFAGGGIEQMILHQAFGRGLVLEPYLASVVLAGGLVARLASDGQRQTILAGIISGATRLALAYGEPDGRYDGFHVETRAERRGNGYQISGQKAVVLHGDSADMLVVTARTSGKTTDRDGISAFLVDPHAEGVTVRGYPTIDGLRAAEIDLQDVQLDADALLGSDGEAGPALGAIFASGRAALCAEAVGAMEVACDQTLDYLKSRKQFNTTIGSFQALQHRMVDMRIALEQSRSMAILAACSLDLTDEDERDRKLAAAKMVIGTAGRYIAEQSIQLHGAMGMTDETAISHYAKRLVMIDHYMGDADDSLSRFMELTA